MQWRQKQSGPWGVGLDLSEILSSKKKKKILVMVMFNFSKTVDGTKPPLPPPPIYDAYEIMHYSVIFNACILVLNITKSYLRKHLLITTVTIVLLLINF